MKIRVLSKETYEKIAAGEIIDRPASVVRELLDNAIDAESNLIKLRVTEGGRRLIQVHDNGFGMSKEDLLLCYRKHSTSKIKDFDDIYKTISLGFRGEALNSISIISEIEISSKTAEDTVGYAIKIKGGEKLNEKEVARNSGTSINVENLFYNIPVRQKALKSEIAEFRQIKETFIHKAIPFYDREFHLSHNGKDIYNSLKSQSPLQRIELFYGKNVKQHLIEVDEDFEGFHVIGYISEANFFKKSKKFQSIYINQRPIFSPALSHAISMGYEGVTPIGQFPLAFIFIQISPELLDVNIHPTKREVKLSNERQIHQGLHHLIKKSLNLSPSLPKIEFKENIKSSIEQFYNKQKYKPENNLFVQPHYHNQIQPFSKTSIQGLTTTNKIGDSSYKILATLFNTYILIEKDNELILLDQHAAHERLQYEKIKAKTETGHIPSQPLLTPFIIDVPASEIDEIANNILHINKLGFELELFGEQNFTVNAIPYFLELEQAKPVLEKVLSFLYEDKKIPDSLSFIDEALKMKACRSAVKSGDSLSHDELKHLLNELFNYPNPFACPHGRPTALRLSQAEIERLFLRR